MSSTVIVGLLCDVVRDHDVRLDDGRSVRAYDTGGVGDDAFTVVWHHGSPQTGAPLAPLVSAAKQRHIRLVSYARPGYIGSSPQAGRTVASAASDNEQIADALGRFRFAVMGASDNEQIADALGRFRFAVMGASGGGPHALACAARLPGRVTGAVCLAGLAPVTDDFNWFAGMVAPGGLQTGMSGREARARYAEMDEFDEDSFTPADWAALSGAWSALDADVERAARQGPTDSSTTTSRSSPSGSST
jgi:pimeloyl-ACP methyl ester carboxylesterase